MTATTTGRPSVTRQDNLRDQALRIIRAALVSGEVTPGEIYSAKALADELGISTSPVREAMLALVNEGILEPVRNRGYRVLEVADRDLDEIYDLRLMIEVPAMRRLAERGTDDLSSFRDLARTITQAAQNGDIRAFLDVDRDLHLGLLTIDGNLRLVGIVDSLRMHTRLFGVGQLAKQHLLAESAREHELMLDAIDAKDGDLMQQLMTQHLGHTRGAWSTGRPED